jgi:hypothetical protein
MSTDDLIKKSDLQRIASEGAKIYSAIKTHYEPKENGKFLAIDNATGKAYLGTTSAEAVELARHAHPDTVFYVVKIGFDVVETMVRLYAGKK